MLKIFSEEGEVVIGLVDIENMSNDDFIMKLDSEFNDDEGEILGNLVFEGYVVGEDDDIEELEYRELKFEEYVKELKDFCEKCMND